MEALLSDKTEELELMDGCLRVNNGYDNYLLVWPYGFSLSTKDGVIRVIDDTGQPIVRVGDKIKVSGGECAGCTSEDVAKISVQLPSERCSGPYWIVGAEINKEG
jgi:hypothetical protein